MSLEYQNMLHEVLEKFRPMLSAAEAHAHQMHIARGHLMEAAVIQSQSSARYESDVKIICRMNLVELRALTHALDRNDEALRYRMLATAAHRLEVERTSIRKPALQYSEH